MTSIIAPILVTLVLASQPPTPGSGEKTQTPQSQTKAQGKDTAKAPPTTTTPVVRAETPAPSPPAPQPSGNTNNQLNHPATERGADMPSVINAISTVFIAVLTGVLAYIAWLQRKITEQQRGIMDKQRELMDRQNQIMDFQSGIMTTQLKSTEATALAAQRSADIARDALHLTEAADIHLHRIVAQEMALTPDTRLQLVFRNYGRTRALNARLAWNEWIGQPLPHPSEGLPSGTVIIPAQEEFPIPSEYTLAQIAGDKCVDIASGKIPFGIQAMVRFDDIFGNTITREWQGTYTPTFGFSQGLTREVRTSPNEKSTTNAQTKS